MQTFIFALLLLFTSVWGRSIPKRDVPTGPIANNFPDPNNDPFYQAPSNIASYPPGHVLRTRIVATTITGLAVKSFQVYYRTNDRWNNAVGTVATIWVPGVPQTPAKIFSYQAAEDSLNRDCSPSFAYVNTSSTVEGYMQGAGFVVIPWALAQGYYVVNADDEGPDSAWLVGLMEGHAVLDGVRATINSLSLSSSNSQVALYGYSGGAHSSVWASSIAADYAPELNIIGAAFGGTPVDLVASIVLDNASPQSILVGAGVLGIANGYPEFNTLLNMLLSDKGKQAAAYLRSPNQCTVNIGYQFSGFNFLTLFSENPFNYPLVNKIYRGESLLSNYSDLPIPTPKFPRFQWHGENDNTVAYAPEAQYIEQQCDKGADIRFLSMPGLNHQQAFLTGIPSSFLFIQSAFSGNLGKVQCGAKVQPVPLLSTQSIAGLTYDLNVLIAAMLAQAS